jgi:hypothetical protein
VEVVLGVSNNINIDYQVFNRHSTAKVEPGDVYVRRDTVYRVSVYDETVDRVFLVTTNDPDANTGWIKSSELAEAGFHPCPLELREPALQVFELEETVSGASYRALSEYRQDNVITYGMLRLSRLLPEIDQRVSREYRVPAAQSDEFPEMTGRVVTLPALFYCLTRAEADQRYRDILLPVLTISEGSHWRHQANQARWPLIYVVRIPDILFVKDTEKSGS